MKKSLIALAVAGVFAAPAAMAEVTLSGAIAVGVDIAKSSSATPGTGAANDAGLTTQTLSVGYSNFAISSVDDIGNGNRVEVYLQFLEDLTNSGGAIGNRNSYIGLAGNWGALRLGTNENAYERMLYAHTAMDAAWGPSNISLMGNGPSGAIGAAGSVWERTSETIMYYSPNFNGFSFEVDYALPGSGKRAATSTEPAVSPSLLSIAGEYKPENMPWRGYVGYQKSKDRFYLDTMEGTTPAVSGATGSDETYLLVGGGVTFGNLMVDLIIERAEWEQTGSAITKIKRNAYDLEAKYALPTGFIGASFVLADDPKVTEAGVTEDWKDGGAKSFSIGYWHTLSKQSSLFTIYGRVDNDSEAAYRSGGATAAADGAGRDHQNFIVGIKHVF